MNFSEQVQDYSSGIINKETLEWHEKKSSKDTIMQRVGVITPDGKIVGFGMGVSGPWDPILKQGEFEITVQVDKKWRNRGIGSMLFEGIIQFAVDNGGITLQCGVRETELADLAWLEKRGFKKKLHTFESHLDLSKFITTQNHSVWEDTERSGVRFTSFAEYPQDDVWLQRFFDFYWELAKDAPGMDGREQPDLNVLKKQFENIDREGFILAIDGDKWVAMSIIIKESNEVFYNSLTGVHRDYRGKGLALAIKIKALEYAKEKGAKFVRTHNDSNNSPMLRVNQKLGYEQKPGLYFMEKYIVESQNEKYVIEKASRI